VYFGLPDGVTLTSASGAFTNTAPEPTPLTLLAAGAASLLWMRRKAQSGEG
jgi:hypothetical protein